MISNKGVPAKTDSIQLIANAIKKSNTPEKEIMKVEIAINGKPIPSYVNWIDLLLPPTIVENGSRSYFYPFTCSCGAWGCNGIVDGVHMKVRRNTIEWKAYRKSGYHFLEKEHFVFRRDLYEYQLLSIWRFIQTNHQLYRNDDYSEKLSDWLLGRTSTFAPETPENICFYIKGLQKRFSANKHLQAVIEHANKPVYF